MKHLYRKPLIPALLMAIIILGTCFVTLFEKEMTEDSLRIDKIYNDAQIYIEVLPLDGEGQEINMNTYRGDRAASAEGIKKSAVMMRTSYELVSPSSDEPVISNVYGSNAPDTLAEYKGFKVSWGEGFSDNNFYDEDGIWLCLIDKNLANEFDISVGDEIVIAPCEDYNGADESAPRKTFTVAGIFEIKQSEFAQRSVIVPRSVFTGTDGLLYNSAMMMDCFYKAYRLEIDSAYNRDIDAVVERVENMLVDDYNLVTNARTMHQAIRPIEQKLQIQKFLKLPLKVIIAAAAAVMGLILSLSLKTEIFLRFLMGERRTAVLIKMLLGLLLVLALASAVALGVVWVAAGGAWMATAAKYLGITVAVTVGTMLVPLCINCGKNLVKLYQQREG